MDRASYLASFRDTVRSAAATLRGLSAERAARRPAPDRWSPAEVIGHLVDSASNNHRRFVLARFQEGLSFPGYAQEEWVRAQGYRRADWNVLVDLWESFNLHLAHVIEELPAEELERPRVEHDLHAIAWETVPADEPTTLAYFVRDYVSHLCHHLRQIDPALAAEPQLQRAGARPRRC